MITLRVFIMIRLSILRGGLVFTLMIAACGEKTNQPQPAVPVAAPAASQISTPAAKPAETPAQIMSKANAAFAANRLWSPAGDNALELFIRLKESGENVETAQEALVEIFPIAVRAAKAELLVDRLDEADRILTLLDRATPNSLAVADLRVKMNARRLALQANAEAAAVQTPVAPQVSEVKPTVAPEEPKVTPPAQSPVAEPSNTQAPQVDEPAATTAQPSVNAQQNQAPDRTAEPPPPSQAQPKQTPVTSADVLSAPLTDPKVIVRVPPEYPAVAKHRRIQGWVELEFMVGVDGRASDIQVLEASPSNIFNTAATRALSRWKFQPAQRNGKDEPKRTRTRINFQLN